MRVVTLCLLVFSTTAAQTAGRLTDDLRPLRSLPALPTGAFLYLHSLTASQRAELRATLPIEHPEQAEIVNHIKRDLMPEYEGADVAWDFAYTLTTVLSGKRVTDQALEDLSAALADTFQSAALSRTERTSLSDSTGFRPAAIRTYNALHDLGVSGRNVDACVESMLRAGMMVSGSVMLRVPSQRGPLVRPILPALPPSFVH